MSDQADLPSSPPPPPRDDTQVVRPTSRRRLLQSGLAAAPVLLTLVSRPVLGQTCTTMSGHVSGNMSRPGGATISCTGLTPGFWKQEQHFSSWPSPCIPKTVTVAGGATRQATKFHPTFAGSQFGAKTMLEVLDPTTADTAGLGRHIVAALLNCHAGRTPVLSATQVKNMWAEIAAKGFFEPTVNVRWYARDCVAYLKTTMPI